MEWECQSTLREEKRGVGMGNTSPLTMPLSAGVNIIPNTLVLGGAGLLLGLIMSSHAFQTSGNGEMKL